MACTSKENVRPRRLRKLVCYSITLALLVMTLPVRTLAWGGEGHNITALVAYRLLNPRAKQNVDILLENRELIDVANWPDDMRDPNCVVPGAPGCNPNYRPETVQWHFVDIPISGNGHYSPTADYCRSTRKGDCIVPAIEDFRVILKASTNKPFASQKPEDKRRFHDALSFIIHFLGDIHQPLHCADKNDFGGNSTMVTWQGEPQPWKLHSLWDTYLVRRNIAQMTAPPRDYAHYAEQLIQSVSAAERNYAQLKSNTIKPGQAETVVAWAEASHAIARNVAYHLPQQSGTITLDQSYFNAALPKVEEQLRLGGVRLARVLNEIFDKDIH
jgi:nuclease S1